MRVDQNVWKDDGLCPSTGKWQPQSSQVFERWLVVFGWSPNNLWWYQEDFLSIFCWWFSRWVEKGKSDKRQDFLLRVSSMQPNLGWNQYFTFLLWGSEICYEPGKKLIIVTYHCIGKEYIWLFWHSIWVAIPTKKKMTTQWENLSTGFCFCSSAALQQALAVKSTEWSGILWASTLNCMIWRTSLY